MTHPIRRVEEALPGVPDETTDLVLAILLGRVQSLEDCAGRLGLTRSTLVSRVARAGLPSLGALLDAAWLFRCRQLLDDRYASIAFASRALGDSSPQTTCRRVRRLTGLTALQLRAQVPTAALLGAFCDLLLTPYLPQWQRADLMAPVRAYLGRVAA